MNETAIVPYEAPLSQEFNLQEELDKAVTDAVQENADNASDAQSDNSDSFEDLRSGSNKSFTDDEYLEYLDQEKRLNEKAHVDSSDERFSDKSED